MRRSILAAIVTAALFVTPVAAGNASIALDQAAPTFGSDVTFTFVTAQPYPIIELACVQNGYNVYFAHLWQSNPAPGTPTVSSPFTLSGLNWTSGAASCTATLLYQTIHAKSGGAVFFTLHKLAVTSFEVGP